MKMLVMEVILDFPYLWTTCINIDMTDLFYEREDSNVESYADDTTPYSYATLHRDISVGLKMTV